MGYPTGIEWTDATWNVVGGCTHDSPGCRNCYAQDLAGTRLAHLPLYAGTTDLVKGKHVFNGKLTVLPSEHLAWQWPIRWRGATNPKHPPKMGRGMPSMIFVGDMADLFHEDRPTEHIDRVLSVMERSRRHIFQLLTKRPQIMREHLIPCTNLVTGEEEPWCPHVWRGISAERQKEFDQRWPELEATPAAVRFVSYEPMLGPLDIGAARPDWVIAGCESDGLRAGHPYDIGWVRAIRDECQAAGIAFFLKQLADNGRIVSLPELDGRQWREFPAITKARAAA